MNTNDYKPFIKNGSIQSNSANNSTVSDQALRFSSYLRRKLRNYYGGRIPSHATIAREYSARSGHYLTVSSETIRKWLNGISLPHLQRLSVLVDWLGADLLDALNHDQNPIDSALEQKFNSNIKKLNSDEMQLVLTIIESLVTNKHKIIK